MREVTIEISSTGTFKYFVKASATANTNQGSYASSLIYTEVVEFELIVTKCETCPHRWYHIIVEPFSVPDSIPTEVSVASLIKPEKNSCEPE